MEKVLLKFLDEFWWEICLGKFIGCDLHEFCGKF